MKSVGLVSVLGVVDDWSSGSGVSEGLMGADGLGLSEGSSEGFVLGVVDGWGSSLDGGVLEVSEVCSEVVADGDGESEGDCAVGAELL